MKKIIDFLSSPVVHLVFGFLFYFYIGCCMWQYDSFDRLSAFYGGFFVISLDMFFYGFNTLVDLRKDKKSVGQDLNE